jgi:hypothetical protein
MARKDGNSFDDIAKEHQDQGVEFKFAERKVRGKEAPSDQPAPIESDIETGTDNGL